MKVVKFYEAKKKDKVRLKQKSICPEEGINHRTMFDLDIIVFIDLIKIQKN